MVGFIEPLLAPQNCPSRRPRDYILSIIKEYALLSWMFVGQEMSTSCNLISPFLGAGCDHIMHILMCTVGEWWLTEQVIQCIVACGENNKLRLLLAICIIYIVAIMPLENICFMHWNDGLACNVSIATFTIASIASACAVVIHFESWRSSNLENMVMNNNKDRKNCFNNVQSFSLYV